jgi:hypothetical protein
MSKETVEFTEIARREYAAIIERRYIFEMHWCQFCSRQTMQRLEMRGTQHEKRWCPICRIGKMARVR